MSAGMWKIKYKLHLEKEILGGKIKRVGFDQNLSEQRRVQTRTLESSQPVETQKF